ncbi:vWA domain-containing protein [Pseudooceanicola sp. 502str34]
MHFARALRAAGLRVGPDRSAMALEALSAVNIADPREMRAALAACLTSGPADRAVFDAVFDRFWQDPARLEAALSQLLPGAEGGPAHTPEAGDRRALAALLGGEEALSRPAEETRLDAAETLSAEERLRQQDFDQMSAEELKQARAMIARLRLPAPALPARRHAPAARGAGVDRRAMLRTALRRGGEIGPLIRTAPGRRAPDLVAICDMSGSMQRYSRMMLHFLHAMMNAPRRPRGGGDPGWGQVHAFAFGTRLTNITRPLKQRDVDAALAAAAQEAPDWQGGTRIGGALHAFNRDWARRVLGPGAVVVLITDGLDRGDPAELAAEAARLRRLSRRLVWLNPLLRYDGFAPKARGVAALLPQVDAFRSAHSVQALDDVARLLSEAGDDGEKDRLMRLLPPAESR